MVEESIIDVDVNKRTRCPHIIEKKKRIRWTNKYEIVKEPCGNTLFFGDIKDGKISITCKRCRQIVKIGNIEE